MRAACLSGLLHTLWCAVALTSGLLSLPASGAPIVNTAKVLFDQTGGGGTAIQTSNTIALTSLPPLSTPVVTFYQYAPGVAGNGSYNFDGSMYDTGGSNFTPLPVPKALDGSAVNLGQSVPVTPTSVYHTGEPVFITLQCADRVTDPTVREQVVVTLTSSTGDSETLELEETAPGSGIFSGVIQSAGPAQQVKSNNGVLSVGINSTLTVSYKDPYYPTSTLSAKAFVDPFGIVFDSSTGAPVGNASITVINMTTGQPAQVFGDDGVSTFPATVTSGGTATDSSGNVYTFPPGGFRFPVLKPGNYRFVVSPPTGYIAPSLVPASQQPLSPTGDRYSVVAGSFSDVFTVVPGPALNIDVPIDPRSKGLVLQKTVSQDTASAGDFLQYQLSLQNIDTVTAAKAVNLADRLPFGMRYEKGSLRLNGAVMPDPTIDSDGRTLHFPIGDLAPSATAQIHYVVVLGAGVIPGQAINSAQATANNGLLASNVAQVAVTVQAPFFSGAATLIGRIFEGDCKTPWDKLKGVPNVRVLLEDGSYAVTDKDGQYHFDGVVPGTHVVQVDKESLPEDHEMQSCVENSRFAGRSFSQFVDVQGASLWRANFYTRVKAKAASEIAIRMESQAGSLTPRIEVRGSTAVKSLSIIAVLEQGSRYVPGSATIDGQAAADPVIDGAMATFQVKAGADTKWQHVIEFKIQPEAKSKTVLKAVNLHAQFASCSSEMRSSDLAAIDKLVAELQGKDIERIELVGHTDDQRLSRNCQQRFKDNNALSLARAQMVGSMLADRLKLSPDAISAQGSGSDKPVASNATEAGKAQNRRTEIIVYGRETQVVDAVVCGGALEVKAMADVETAAGKHVQTPVATNRLACGASEAVPAAGTSAATAATDATSVASAPVADAGAVPTPVTAPTVETASAAKPVAAVATEAAATDKSKAPDSNGWLSTSVISEPLTPKAAPQAEAATKARAAIVDDVTAAGGKMDWLAGQKPGIDWLFPAANYNPRAPAVRIVIKHEAGQSVVLHLPSGEEVSPLAYDGETSNADKTVNVNVWRGVPLVEGANVFTAEIKDRDGNIVQRLTHTVIYAGRPMRAEIVPEQSVLIADGVTRPVIALRLLDRDGNPVRAGVTGPIDIGAPFTAWEAVQQQQDRQLAGMDRTQPHYQVEGDDGIAYVELAPTNNSGAVRLSLNFQTGPTTTRRQDMQAWMEPGARKWVVVGFAQGTVGYNTLKDNMQPLQDQGVEKGSYTDDQISLYAKGRILGKWLMTMAYNTAKPTGQLPDGQSSILSTIDPNKYYTLYGDGTAPRYDASSQSKLYLKLERNQFYALFGDYNTGLTQTQLSRYSRVLNGVKAEQGGNGVTYILFAANTPQSYARDEIQGNGTSGLYQLSHPGIVLNSERITIETRDRLHSENILATQQLAAHIDYEIDYTNGTIYFKQPINSRDTGFNPIFIVAEYETFGVASRNLDAGGRVAVKLAPNAVLGVSALHDESAGGRTGLGGADLKVKLAGDSEVRVEAAQTSGVQTNVATGGDAWLTEYERHDGKVDTLLYARRQAAGFGMNQQNASESGQEKIGLDGQYHVDKNWAVQTQVYQQADLGSDDRRDAVLSKVQYSNAQGGASVGAQVISDNGGANSAVGSPMGVSDYRSEQATMAANHWFMDHKLELKGEADTSLGSENGSIDFPDRYMVGMGYSLTKDTRLLVSQEITDGSDLSTSTTRAGIETTPWKGAKLNTSLNQSDMSEYGPRTFGNFGLTQGVVINSHWGVDFNTDSSHTFYRAQSQTAPVINPNEPIAPGGGTLTAATLTEDYNAFSTGATYRSDLWSWNGRAETRFGQDTDKNGVVSNFLRQARSGVAFGSSAQLFRVDDHTSGSSAVTGSADLALAWRPLGVQWSILDRLEYRFNSSDGGSGVPGSGLFGFNSLVTTGNAITRHLINNFAIDHISREWTGEDQQGNLFTRYERSQWTLYYGAKYATDNFDGTSYNGYTDLIGLEMRHDLNSWMDLGLQASSLNGWSTHTHSFSVGPQFGFSPMANGWVTLGFNFRGFRDQDFEAARYTAQGVYLQLRFKFDQDTRFGHGDTVADKNSDPTKTTRVAE